MNIEEDRTILRLNRRLAEERPFISVSRSGRNEVLRLRQLEREEVEFAIIIEPEEAPVEGCMATGDAEADRPVETQSWLVSNGETSVPGA